MGSTDSYGGRFDWAIAEITGQEKKKDKQMESCKAARTRIDRVLDEK